MHSQKIYILNPLTRDQNAADYPLNQNLGGPIRLHPECESTMPDFVIKSEILSGLGFQCS